MARICILVYKVFCYQRYNFAQVTVHHSCVAPVHGDQSSSQQQTNLLLLGAGRRNLVVERQGWKGGRREFLCCGTLSIYSVWSPRFRGWAEQDHVWVLQMTRKGKLVCSFFPSSKGLPQKSMATTQTSSNQSKGTNRKTPPHIISHNKHWFSRKPQQREAEHSGGLHGYTITKNQNMKTQWPQQTGSQRHNKHKNKPLATHHRQKWRLQPAKHPHHLQAHQVTVSQIHSTSQYKPLLVTDLIWTSQETIQSCERIKVRL